MYIAGGTLVWKDQGGSEEKSVRASKEVLFRPRNRVHSEEAVGSTPRAMIIELK